MRKVFLFFALSCFGIALAQDVIVKKDGSTILAKVTKVGDTEIEYKKFNSSSDRLYSISTSNVMSINYEDGEKDVFDSNNNTQKDKIEDSRVNSGPVFVDLPADSYNRDLITEHNSCVQFAKEPKNKKAKWCFPIMAMSESSIISNKEIEMRIIPTIVCDMQSVRYRLKYRIELKNKTDKILYVDLANSFKIFDDGTSETFYDNQQTTISHGSSTGAAVNMGGIASAIGVGGVVGKLASGINVGGASQNGVSTTYTSERILAIPPHSKKDIKEFKQVPTKASSGFHTPRKKIISDIDEFVLPNVKLGGVLKEGEHIYYTEEESPYSVKHMITYSCSADFSTYSQLLAKVYARYVVGGEPYGRNDVKMVKDIKKCISNFMDDPGVIVGLKTPLFDNKSWGFLGVKSVM